MADDKKVLFESYRELPPGSHSDSHTMDEYPRKRGPVEWDASFARRWHITVHERIPGEFVALALMTFVGSAYEPNMDLTYRGSSGVEAVKAASAHDAEKADRGYRKATPWADLDWQDLYGRDPREWDETWLL